MTYSLSITGSRAYPNPNPISNLTLSDVNATAGAQANAVMRNTDILCKGPDGRELYYRIDAERSIPGQAPILLPVGRG